MFAGQETVAGRRSTAVCVGHRIDLDSVQTRIREVRLSSGRPETAVDQAGSDNNDATEAQAGWVPLLLTPPYPSHASNMQCVGAGAARMLANVFGDDAQAFTATWYSADTPPAVVHAEPYESFWAMAVDEGNSRVWGGIHFRFELTASQVSCTQVADYLFDNYMQPHRKH